MVFDSAFPCGGDSARVIRVAKARFA
jgi:hypothetical protein